MIQRWQSVMLLFSIVCTVVFLFLPFGGMLKEGAVVDLNPFCYVAVWCPAIASALLQLIAIFSYKFFRLQKNIIWISCLLTVTCGASAVILTRGAGGECYVGSCLMLIGALILSLLAIVFIRKDQKLLASLNRLR